MNRTARATSAAFMRSPARYVPRRESPLMCFPQADGTWYVAGSNFGLPKHPAWSANLIANPDADVHHGRRLTAVRATLFTPDFTPDEAEAIWPTFEEQWPRYRDYEKTAQRGIRVFRLMPAMGYV